MRVGLKESLLQDILGIIVVLGDLVGPPVKAGGVVLHQLVKGGLVTGFSARYQCCFVEGGGYGRSTHCGCYLSLAAQGRSPAFRLF